MGHATQWRGTGKRGPLPVSTRIGPVVSTLPFVVMRTQSIGGISLCFPHWARLAYYHLLEYLPLQPGSPFRQIEHLPMVKIVTPHHTQLAMDLRRVLNDLSVL